MGDNVGVITLVLGGARSGKSAVAEARAARAGEAVTYVATTVADPGDADLAGRIAAHVARRPPLWTTVEVAPEDLADVLSATPGPVMVDSLGAWVASSPEFEVDGAALCTALVLRAGTTVVVSDEAGLGVHPASEVGRRFRDILGQLNQEVAAVADDVLLVVAGRIVPLESA